MRVITQRRVDSNYPLDLGFGINIRDSASGFFQCVKSDYVSGTNIQKKWRGGSESTDEITSTSTEATMKIAGSLSIEADIAKMAEISGEAHMDYHDTNKEKSLVRCFTSNVFTDEYQLDCSNLEPKHLMDPENVPTHIVTNVVKGVSLTGSITLKDRTSDNSLKAGGSLQIKLASFPLGGKAEVDIDMEKFNQEYEFKAKLISLNYGKPLEIGSYPQFCETVSKWFQEEGGETIPPFCTL
jgi:polyisoprenoid-binding protein YceI